ncbi:hypothetical protein [Hydrogenobacter hydrogenophilus]|uniref:Uncharacterized protein n=1 Tax=Hydrogenobacter hydrogenophilus TaxID=35835 RepID=A0A285PA10_9AQUI|nr:hypothetical protein [Hydrogenobacter hydrogenophilus]SNZ16976.1 hypothetical protein SAMN06265353_1751 [Hydrogenobacter hydrogenophilus]
MLADTIYRLMLFGFLMVLFACFYAILYAFGKVARLPSLQKLSYSFGLLQFLSGLGMFFSDYLDFFWRIIVLFSAFAYIFIPPLMWKVVVAFHRE